MTECDAVVVGSGPGGALCAYELARAGKSVVVLEAGPKVRHGDTRRDAGQVLSRYFFYGGMRSTRGNTVMPSMQPRNLGGGSVWNSAICLRTPPFALQRWRDEHGLDFTSGQLDRHFDEVEKFMGVRPVTDDVLGVRNELFAEACEKMGFTPTRILRNENGCKGSAECFTLCPNDAKLSMDRRGIPEVLELDGTVYTSVSAHEIIKSGSRAGGVRGFVVDPITKKRSHKVEIRAKMTVLAAGCLATPELLQRSKLGNENVGKNLRFHPGSMVMGSFDEDIEPWSGATQGYHCLDFLPDEGIKLEALWATSSLMASRFPGLGTELVGLLHNYRKMCSWDCWVSGEDSVGQVQYRPGRRADIIYNVGQGDCDRMAESLAKLCEMFFSVGATSVMTGVPSLPAPVSDRSIIDMLRLRKYQPQGLPLASNHIFGTTAMGPDRRRHAVDPSGAVYETDDLYVCDTGLLPGTPGANPMLPTMGLVHMIAEELNRRY